MVVMVSVISGSLFSALILRAWLKRKVPVAHRILMRHQKETNILGKNTASLCDFGVKLMIDNSTTPR